MSGLFPTLSQQDNEPQLQPDKVGNILLTLKSYNHTCSRGCLKGTPPPKKKQKRTLSCPPVARYRFLGDTNKAVGAVKWDGRFPGNKGTVVDVAVKRNPHRGRYHFEEDAHDSGVFLMAQGTTNSSASSGFAEAWGH